MQNLSVISLLSQASIKKHNASGISIGEGRGEQHTRAERIIRLPPDPLCGELVRALSSPLGSRPLPVCNGFMLLSCLWIVSWQYSRKVLFHVVRADTQCFGMMKTVRWFFKTKTCATVIPTAFVPNCTGKAEDMASVRDF